MQEKHARGYANGMAPIWRRGLDHAVIRDLSALKRELYRQAHHMQEKKNPPGMYAVLSRVKLTLDATCPNISRRVALGASNVYAWSAKTGCAPSRNCRDARVYDHKTTAMHDMSTPPQPPSAPLPSSPPGLAFIASDNGGQNW